MMAMMLLNNVLTIHPALYVTAIVNRSKESLQNVEIITSITILIWLAMMKSVIVVSVSSFLLTGRLTVRSNWMQ